MRALWSLFALVLPVAALAAANEIPVTTWSLQDASKVPQTGEQLSVPKARTGKWIRAVVPGTVLTSLVAAGMYPEPLYGENNRRIPESLCRTSYWYRSEIAVPRSYLHRHVWLRFDGINYKAEVWVSGHRAGSIAGAFARGLFDITNLVIPGQSAGIAVLVQPPAHPGNPEEQTQTLETGRNGGALGADGPTFEATVGWDWIPGIRDRDMGIWQGVSLLAGGPVKIEDPYIVTSLPPANPGRAVITVKATVRNVEDHSVHGTLKGAISGSGVRTESSVTLKPKETREVKLVMLMPHPRLWWPNGYGRPSLYDLQLRFIAGKLSDETHTQFGVRTIQYFRPGGKNLTIIVNGVPIFGKGGNWGIDEAMKRSPRTRLEAQIRMHRDAHCTMIRNWIGMSTQEDFYDLCDRYGILVWDDFWLANPVDGPDPVDPQLFLDNAREKILRFRNHPSIALWCGRNEGNPPPRIEGGLEQLTAQLDGQRLYQKHSAAYNGVGGGGPYSFLIPDVYFRRFRPNDAFHTEMGAPSIPTLEALQAMMPRKDWWPINDDWAEHDFCMGAQGGDSYPMALAKRYGPVTGLEDFIQKGQMANYETYRAIFESRNAKLFAPNTGTLLWMSNPAQPSFVWQMYTHDLEPNAALFATEKACEPIHIQMDPKGAVQVVNNSPDELKRCRVEADVFATNARQYGRQEISLSAAPSAATTCLQVAWPSGAGDDVVWFVKLRLMNSAGELLSQNFYWATRSGVNDYATLNRLPKIRLNIQSTKVAGGRLRVVVKNPVRAVVLMAHIQLRRRSSGERVLPVFYSDNYISLLPFESREITVEYAEKDLLGDKPEIWVDGWNVAPGVR